MTASYDVGGALVLQGNANRLPFPDASVSLICFSPPYFSLRSYRDGGEHYEGQVGSEPTPQEFLEALWVRMKECWRVLRPDGSCFVNLADKRSGAGGHNNAGLGLGNLGADRMRSSTLSGGKRTSLDAHKGGDLARAASGATRRNAPDRYNQAAFGRPKSKMLLPHRFAIGCEDGLADPEGIGWVLRSDIVWSKTASMPESVTDRCRDSHEYVFHLTKSERYYSAVDEIRSTHTGAGGLTWAERKAKGEPMRYGDTGGGASQGSPGQKVGHLSGRLPGSVWTLGPEPLIVSDEIREIHNLPEHFASYPSNLVRRIILGWSPAGICTVCDEGRVPVVERTSMVVEPSERRVRAQASGGASRTATGGTMTEAPTAQIIGYACSCTPQTVHTDTQRVHDDSDACDGTTLVLDGYNLLGEPLTSTVDCADPEHWHDETTETKVYDLAGWNAPPTRPSVVLDCFGGTGTTAGTARALGRLGVSVDLSFDYCRLARWRVWESGHFAKVVARTNREAQTQLL